MIGVYAFRLSSSTFQFYYYHHLNLFRNGGGGCCCIVSAGPLQGNVSRFTVLSKISTHFWDSTLPLRGAVPKVHRHTVRANGACCLITLGFARTLSTGALNPRYAEEKLSRTSDFTGMTRKKGRQGYLAANTLSSS